MIHAKLFCSAAKLQSVFRRHLTCLKAKELREFRAICEAQNIMRVESTACVATQKWWRLVLHQRDLAENKKMIARVLLENTAATAIVSDVMFDPGFNIISFTHL